MKINLFCFIICSLNTLTITSNRDYSRTLSYDNDVEVIEAHATVKRNTTQVPDYEEPDYEEPDYEEYEYEKKEEKEDKFTDLFPGEHLPSDLFKMPIDDPCEPSPCGINFWHWRDEFNGNLRFICLPNHVRSPPNCNPACPVHSCYGPQEPPCSPSPCGPHSECREVWYNEWFADALCRCQKGFIGTPPNCRRECTINSECASDKACLNRVCVDPCVYKCARNANCTVIAHKPICSCQDGFAGDPFTNCMPLSIPTQRPKVNPCIPSPCGPYSQCQEFNGLARCSCLPNYSSSPPRCRLECTIASACNADMACINNRCTDPCPTACGKYAQCIVKNHIPYCTCLPDSCQALDQTFDFPRYSELDIMKSRPKGPGFSKPCIQVCSAFVALCPRGTERINNFCVKFDDL